MVGLRVAGGAGGGHEVLVVEHCVVPRQPEEAQHAAHRALGVEHETLVVDGQTARADAELLALLQHRLCAARPVLQTLAEVAQVVSADRHMPCRSDEKQKCNTASVYCKT